MDFDVHYIYAQLPALWRGLLMTLEVSSISIAISILAGMAGAAIKVMRVPVLTPLINGYVEFIRNTPLLAQMFFIYFGLPSAGVTLSLFWSGVLTLSLWASAYQIETFAAVSARCGPVCKMPRWRWACGRGNTCA